MKRFLLTNLLVFCFLVVGWSQSLENLRAERERIQQEISVANKLLVSNKNEQQSAEQNINLLLSQIHGRKKIISSINFEISSLKSRIGTSNAYILSLEDDIKQFKHEYELLILELYKRRSGIDFVSYLLSSNSFNQAYQRYRMMQEMNDYRKKQILVLQQTEQLLIKERNNLLALKTELESRLADLNSENRELSNKKSEHEQYVKTLKGKERQLYTDIAAKKKRDAALEAELADIIRSLAKDKPKTNQGKDFGKNRGSLIPPVKKGVLISRFGEHEHPVIKGVIIKNNGIDLKVDDTPTVYSVFDGEVSRIVTIPGFNKAVIIRHGKYLTVYANLGNVTVHSGDKIVQGQSIGTIYTGGGSNTNTLHFELWNENLKENPENWIKDLF